MYRLRWVFNYRDGTRRQGVWNGASPHKRDMACMQPKDRLHVAEIEGETRQGLVHKLLQVDGHSYVSSTWERFVRVPMSGMPGNFKSMGELYGLSFYTPQEKITVTTQGKIIKRPLSDKEKQFKTFSEHKK